MSTRMRDLIMGELGALRYEPTQKRIRATVGDATVVDSTRALLVWEPKRIVPSYAVPVEDVAGEVAAANGDAAAAAPPEDLPMLGARPVLDPSVPFAVHTTEGEPVTVAGAAGFRPADPALDGFVILDFAAFDAWYEEDERNVGHPRDPFHRIDIVSSSRHVRVEHGDQVLAEATDLRLLFEPPLPVRYYLRPEDVRTDLLQPSDHRSTCAYKGHATYVSAEGVPNVAWTYPEPLREAAAVTGRYAFFNERVDIRVDGELLERPVTPWSKRGS